jgi:hypothetical protein
MSQITIQCRLFADETARRYLWELMTDRNTPLVNELLRLVALHSDFLTWRSKGKIPTKEFTKLAKTLDEDSRFNNQPAKFRISAEKTALYTFKSWVAIQKRTQWRLEGKISWLRMLRTNEESIADCGQDLEQIRLKAQALLLQYQSSEDSAESRENLRKSLYQAYDKTEEALCRSAIAYLLRNRCQIPSKTEEDLEKFLKYRRKIENQIKSLTQQLENRLPQGRDLTEERFLNILETATRNDPVDDAEFSRWQSQLLERPDLVPFPIILESNMDLKWFSNEHGKIGLHIGDINEHEFTIGCGQRQLHYFQRFLSDYQTMLASKRQHTSSLFLLRSAKLIWVPSKGQDESWNVHQLYLSCTLDTQLLTAEGTELVKQKVAASTNEKLVKMRGKPDRNDNQDNYIKRLQSTLNKIARPFARPSKPLYRGQSNIMVAVSMGLQSPITAIAIDLTTQQILTYRSTKQLLGDNYRLLNRQRSLQTRQRHLNHNAQKKGSPRQFSNSELGEHLDRLLAKAIVELAQSYRADSIALPKLDQIRLIIQSEVDAMAQQKIPDYLEGQKKYAKQVRINLHNWSYNRLSESIISKAAQSEIAIEYGTQPARASPNVREASSRNETLRERNENRAREIALSAYAKRTVS